MSEKAKRASRRAATLADVGKIAGVSAMAASAVLNHSRTSSRISEETRKRILEAAKELNYRPNVAARSLVNRRMNTLGVTVKLYKDELNMYFLEVFNGIMEAAMRSKQNTTVFTVSGWDDFSEISGFCDGRIDGMILVGPVFKQEGNISVPHNTPFVSLHTNRPLAGVPNLETDEENGAYLATEHLISKGHRRIMHVSGPLDLLGAARRKRGFDRALRDAGISSDESMILHADFSTEHTLPIFRAWLQGKSKSELPEAIFAVNDAAALGCIEALVGAGHRVPDDVSVMGFDDSLAARSAHFSSVRQPLREMGHRAVKVLLEMIDGTRIVKVDEIPEPILFQTDLCIRNT